jgi:hypothetical protein
METTKIVIEVVEPSEHEDEDKLTKIVHDEPEKLFKSLNVKSCFKNSKENSFNSHFKG